MLGTTKVSGFEIGRGVFCKQENFCFLRIWFYDYRMSACFCLRITQDAIFFEKLSCFKMQS